MVSSITAPKIRENQDLIPRELCQASASLEAWMLSTPNHTEWVDGQLLEKTGMTLKHSVIQSRLDSGWRNYMNSSAQGGEVYTDVPCRTLKQGRRPDVAYLTSELVEQYGQEAVLPQSFPLIAEIISPTDLVEEVFAKAQEYLQSGCQEIWLVLPESKYIFVMTEQQVLCFPGGTVASTQVVLQGFNVAVDELLV
jgi:Uma2 family endonuclease